MVDKEMLSAMEKMFEAKLEEKTAPMMNLIVKMQVDIVGMKSDITGLKSDMAGMKSDIAGMKSDIAELKSDMVEVKSDIVGLKSETADLRLRMDSVESELKYIKVIQLENEVIPRLKHIEQCYLSTSDRYMEESGKIPKLVHDTDNLLKTVEKHSGRLNIIEDEIGIKRELA